MIFQRMKKSAIADWKFPPLIHPKNMHSKRVERGVFGIFSRKRDCYAEEPDKDPILLEIMQKHKDGTPADLYGEYIKKNLVS
jgi:hypothetical protein